MNSQATGCELNTKQYCDQLLLTDFDAKSDVIGQETGCELNRKQSCDQSPLKDSDAKSDIKIIVGKSICNKLVNIDECCREWDSNLAVTSIVKSFNCEVNIKRKFS